MSVIQFCKDKFVITIEWSNKRELVIDIDYKDSYFLWRGTLCDNPIIISLYFKLFKKYQAGKSLKNYNLEINLPQINFNNIASEKATFEINNLDESKKTIIICDYLLIAKIIRLQISNNNLEKKNEELEKKIEELEKGRVGCGLNGRIVDLLFGA
jgi:hypothetical protein